MAPAARWTRCLASSFAITTAGCATGRAPKTLSESTAWAEHPRAVPGDREGRMTVGAVALTPELAPDEIGHECNVRDIELWFLDQKKVGLIHFDQTSGGSVLCLTEALVQFPDQGGMEHAILASQIPRIGERRLTRWRRASVNLSIKPVCVGLIHPRHLVDQTGTRTQFDEPDSLQGACRRHPGRQLADSGCRIG